MFVVVVFTVILIPIYLFLNRSPNRLDYNYESEYVYSPCNGYIRDIKPIDNGTRMRIVFFLNLKDNHTQYFPLTSSVLEVSRYKGSNYHAYSIESDKNSNVETLLYNREYDITYKITQRTGMIARRILHYASPSSNEYKVGDKLGFIVLGSRVDIDLPINKIENILVNIGDKVSDIQKIAKLRS